MRKVNLATTETVSANYAGDDAGRFISAALLSATSIENGAVEVVEGIKYKWNVPNVNLSGIVQNATCDFTPLGTVTIADRVLTLEEYEVNLQLCVKTYYPLWDSISQRGGFTGPFEDYLIGLVAANIAASRETVLWSGANATAGQFDGFEVLMTSQATQPAGMEIAAADITAANVIAKLASVIDAAPSALYAADGFAIRIPTNVLKHYKQAQAALGAYDAYNEREATPNFLGVPLIHCSGMTDNILIATKANNFFYGVGSLSDFGSASVIDQRPVTGAGNVHVSLEWGDGCQIGNAADVVTYGITNGAN